MSALYFISIIFGDYFAIAQFTILVLFSIVMMIFWFSIGIIISLKVRSYKTRDLILNTLLLPISFTAPIFFSLDNSPIFIRLMSQLNPLTYQLNALRDISFGSSNRLNVIIVLVMTVVVSIIAIYSVRNAELTTDER